MLRRVSLDTSGRQLQQANTLGSLPIVLIAAGSFFKPSVLTFILPLRAANQLRAAMHEQILAMSSHAVQIQAERSDHFVWVDQPEMILKAIRSLISTAKL